MTINWWIGNIPGTGHGNTKIYRVCRSPFWAHVSGATFNACVCTEIPHFLHLCFDDPGLDQHYKVFTSNKDPVMLLLWDMNIIRRLYTSASCSYKDDITTITELFKGHLIKTTRIKMLSRYHVIGRRTR